MFSLYLVENKTENLSIYNRSMPLHSDRSKINLSCAELGVLTYPRNLSLTPKILFDCSQAGITWYSHRGNVRDIFTALYVPALYVPALYVPALYVPAHNGNSEIRKFGVRPFVKDYWNRSADICLVILAVGQAVNFLYS